MALPNVKQVWQDPDFLDLHPVEKAKVMRKIDPEFAALPSVEQNRVIFSLSQQPETPQNYPQAETGYTPGEIETKRRQFVADEGTLPTRIKEGAKDFARDTVRTVVPMLRPVLEGGGAVGGTIVGGGVDLPTGVIPGAVAGAALGYAGGAKAADVLEGLAGVPTRQTPDTVGGQLVQSAKDIGTGAAMEMGGQVIGDVVLPPVINAIGKGYAGAKNLVRRATAALPTVTEAGIQRRAGNVLAENMSDNPRFAANLEATNGLDIPGYQPSIAEATNDPGLIKLQRSIERAPGQAASTIAEQKAANQEALRSYLDETFPGIQNVDDVAKGIAERQGALESAVTTAKEKTATALDSLPAAPAQQTGEEITKSINEAAAPVKSEMEQRFAELPNYPVTVPNLRRMIDEQRAAKLPKDQKEKLGSILNYIDEQAQTGQIGLHDLRAIDQTINQYWVQSQNRMNPNFDELLTGFYGRLKGALRTDLNQMGARARSGGIQTVDGQVVDTAGLSGELEKTLDLLQQAKAKPDQADVAVMGRELVEKGGPQYMRMVRESDESYAKRITDDYRRVLGKEPPIKPDSANGQYIANLTAKVDDLRGQLDRIEPGQDVATMYNRANRYAENQYFNRFERGAVGETQRFGNEANRLRKPFEEMAREFTTPTGADDLIRAVGPDEAQRLMFQHYSQDLLRKVNPATGELSASAAARWVRENGPSLTKYGLADKFGDVVKMQSAADDAGRAYTAYTKTAAAKFLGADVDKAVEAAMQTSPKNTGAAIKNLLDTVGDNPDARTGLENAFRDFIIAKAETMNRNIAGDAILSPAAIQKAMQKFEPAMQVLYANAPEKLDALKRVQTAIEIQGRSARSPLGGGSDTAENMAMAQGIMHKLAGPVMRWGSIGLGVLNKLNSTQINNLLAKAMYDPDLAMTLIKASKETAQPTERRLNQHLIRLGIVAANQPDRQQ